MNTVKERLELIQNRMGLSKIELGEMAGAKNPSQTVNNWIKRDSITDDAAMNLSKKTGLSFQWILKGIGKIDPAQKSYSSDDIITGKVIDTTYMDKKKSYLIKSLDIKRNDLIMAKNFVENIFSIEYEIGFARTLFGNMPEGQIQIISVMTDSMKGTIDPSSDIYIDISVNKFIGDGIYVFKYKSFDHMKRLQMQGDKIAIISDNPKYSTWYIDLEQIDNIEIIGQVAGHQPNSYIRHR